ncbi:iron chelate uptake ABC transporter family permease subunit [Cytobacillus oceanisediminis]|jgi:iron complex transport system permease protein|uniref:Iron chelate uptake ABC transporter family permease subunit n=2 Tax=Niallia TaxID=2837506 RepID=A0A941GPZ4_NIACI|nr:MULTISPECIES: iron chelate uptake ABC transporter family permease subunit [Bacillaceae]MDU1847708.1 iron chelate uptake ABC transporter family permease subunit [Niallia nealsonii]MBZ9536310.1 iron chelate uptake ABC transporter family permease subunit [Cytobacillus oceanisediminis]MCB5239771.1 iron chelate uptake ABC transporter family permease subunit [Niallia circulans]MED3792572.1 iron chelate uptake ABC transporter family permease subunit [Niallia alba]NMO75733.1 iron chelate uptake ABC
MMNESMNLIMVGRLKRRRRFILVTCLLAIISFALCWTMLMLGNTIYPVSDVISVLLGEQVKGASFAVGTIRFPRMVAGVFAGFAFGISGYVFQTMLRNPLANPNVIGITTGSSAAAVFCIIVLHASSTFVSIASIIGGLVTVIVIFLLSKGSSFSIGRLILIGIGIQAMLNAVISYLLLIGQHHDVPTAMRWLSGSLNGAKMENVYPLIIAVLLFAPIIILLGKRLDMLELGEQTATSLGIHTDRTRLILIISSVLIIALATATTGPIAFVAFLSGPIAKRLVGIGFSSVIPAGLVGIILVLASDLIGQFAFVARYPVGVITGILGAPYLIMLLIRMNRREEL